MKILDYNDKINNIEFKFESIVDYEFFEKEFLDKINKLNNLEEISIPLYFFQNYQQRNIIIFLKINFKLLKSFLIMKMAY